MRCWQCNKEITDAKRPTKRYCSKHCEYQFNYYAQQDKKSHKIKKRVCAICFIDFIPQSTDKSCLKCRKEYRRQYQEEYDKTKRKRKYKGSSMEKWTKAHREHTRIREFKLREERRKKGLCPYDGRKPEGPYLTCEKCRTRDKRAARNKRLKKRNRKRQ